MTQLDDYDDGATERSSPVNDTLSQTSSPFLYSRSNRRSSFDDYTGSPASSGSRPTTTVSHSRSRSERSGDGDSYSTHSRSTGSSSRRSAGELIAMFEDRAATSRSATPFAPTTRSASPVKSGVSGASQPMPGGLPPSFRRTGPLWTSTSEYAYTYSRPSSPSKTTLTASTSSSWSFSASNNSGNYDTSRTSGPSRSRQPIEHRFKSAAPPNRQSMERRAAPAQPSGSLVPPPLDLSEYGCTGRVRHSAIFAARFH